MVSFAYETLDLDRPSVRLFQLCKGVGPELSGHIHHAWLDDRESMIPYEAVSYTWGSLDIVEHIDLEEGRLGITRNPHVALQHLRLPDEDRMVWVDAICINQDDLRERGHQVQQMGHIYKQASKVIVWLGVGTDDTDILMDSLDELQQASNALSCRTWSVNDARWTQLWAYNQTHRREDVPGIELETVQRRALNNLLSRPWWERVWVLQEVANARSCWVQCGEKTVRSSFVALAPVLMGVDVDAHCQAVLDILPGPSRQNSWWSRNHDLYMLLKKFSSAKASDPRDRVYALLGMSSDSSDPTSPGYIRPDYTKSTVELTHDLCRFLFFDLLPSSATQKIDSIEDLSRDLENLNRAAMKSPRLSHELIKLTMRIGPARLADVERWEAVRLAIELLKQEGVHVHAGNKPWKMLARSTLNTSYRPERRDDCIVAYVHKAIMRLLPLLQDTSARSGLPGEKGDGPERTDSKLPVNSRQMVFLDLLPAIGCDSFRRIALSHAAGAGSEYVVRLLLQRGFDQMSKDIAGWTPLSYAAANGHLGVAQLLVNDGADLESEEEKGMTPISLAAAAGHQPMVTYLLSKGSPQVLNQPPLSSTTVGGWIETAMQKSYASFRPKKKTT